MKIAKKKCELPAKKFERKRAVVLWRDAERALLIMYHAAYEGVEPLDAVLERALYRALKTLKILFH